MKNKTCVDCKHFEVDAVSATCENRLCICDDDTPACRRFELRAITNGDVIRRGNNRKLAEIFDDLYNGNKCKYCIHRGGRRDCKLNPTPYSEYDEGYLDDEDCLNGFEAWLDSLAEIEEDNGCR